MHIRLDLPDGMRLWVNPFHIILFFDDPELEYDDEHVALVKLSPGAMAQGNLIGVTQSAEQLKQQIWEAQFQEPGAQ